MSVPVNKAAPGGGSDINLAFRPDDNRRLIVHEYSGLESGDSTGLRTVQDFITNRTDPTCPPAERLHAIWYRSDFEIAFIYVQLIRLHLGYVFPRPMPLIGALEKV